MSNFLQREFVATYRWLQTFLLYQGNPTVRRLYRGQMKDNRVWASLFNWLRGRNVG